MEGLAFTWVLLVFFCFGVLGVDNLDEHAVMLSMSSQLKVQEGETIELPCKVLHVERLVRVWKQLPSRVLFSGTISVSRDEKISLGPDGSLHIHDVTAEYEGEYSCHFHQRPGLNVLHRIRVLVPPTIMPGPASGKVIVRRDSPVVIFCNASGSPFPTVSWTFEKDDTFTKASFPSGVRFESHNTQLVIASVDVQHTGLYRCTADNDVGGPVTATFNLTVLYVPEVTATPEWIHGDTDASMEFVCTCKSMPIAHVTWMKGVSKVGQPLLSDDHLQIKEKVLSPTVIESSIRIQRLTRDDLGSYTCKAKNTVGQAWKTVDVSGLAEAVQLRGMETSENSYSLLWTSKSYSPIIEYKLKLRKHKGETPDWTDVVIPPAEEDKSGILYSQSYEVTGVEPGTLYEALVLVHNHFGWNRAPETLLFHTGVLITEPVEISTDESMMPHMEDNTVITEQTYLKQDMSTAENVSSSLKRVGASTILLITLVLTWWL